MSTTSFTLRDGVPSRPAGKDRRPGSGRLIAVELRKMVNTRSGFWLPIGVALVSLLVAIIASSNHGGKEATFTHVLHAVAQPSAFLLPVMGVLLICGEWSQRTTLTTFTLVPSRWRVIGAKVGASLIVSTIGLAVCLLFSVVFASLLGHHPGGPGSLSWQVIGQSWLFIISGMVMGLAFGAAVLVSAPAIVTYLLLPTIWGAIIGNISALRGVARWLDAANTLDPLTLQPMSGIQWAHAAATWAMWIGIPLAVGVRRIGRGDLD
jgi:ABC-type transport system involved in multi-copper enzyme maturation permease subunit